MKRFIIKLSIIALLSSICILGLLYYYHGTQANTLDPFYNRFTANKQPSLILGSSRSAQGLRPDIFNTRLNQFCDTPFYNYSFTLGTSNIGKTYLKKIKSRIKQTGKGLYILCVDPWIFKKNNDKNGEVYNEDNTFFAKQITQHMSPNVEYMLLYDNQNRSFYNKIFNPKESIYYLHNNGWLQVNYDISKPEAIDNSNWQLHLYQEDSKSFILSDNRFIEFENYLNYLSQCGTLIVIRLPTSDKMKQIEQNAFPDFDKRIEKAVNKFNISYINLIESSGKYQTLDGNHIYKDATKQLSLDICDTIKTFLNYKK